MTTTTMSGSLNITEITKQVKEAPVQLGNVYRSAFVDQELVTQNTKAILALEDKDTRLGSLDAFAHEFQLDVYQRHLEKCFVLGQPYVQWLVEKKLCEKYEVAFTAPRPDRLAPPADLAYTTMWVKWDKDRVKAMADKMRARIRERRGGAGPEPWPVYEPPTTPLPGPKRKRTVSPKTASTLTPTPAPAPAPVPARAPAPTPAPAPALNPVDPKDK